MNNATRIENAIEWIRRLGTTKMKQGKGRLGNREIGFCPLGFGCFINGVPYDRDDMANSYFQNVVGLQNIYGCSNMNLPDLVDLNDEQGYTFKSISGELNQHPAAYFIPAVAKGIQKHLRSK